MIRQLVVELVTADLVPVQAWKLDLADIPPVSFGTAVPQLLLRARLVDSTEVLPLVPIGPLPP